MITIFKYKPTANGCVEMPVGAVVRKAGIQDGALTLWAEVDTLNGHGPSPRTFQLVGTGQKVPHRAKYVDTLLMPSGLVWHVYDLGDRSL